MNSATQPLPKRIRHINPSALIAISFLLAIVVGTALLLLPQAHVGELSVIDALFTATSATCVTGLTTVDTGTRFTHFGQIVILALIQCGGLGIITLSMMFLSLVGKRLGLQERMILQESISQVPMRNFFGLLLFIVLVTFAIEGIGAALLYSTIRQESSGAGEALYYSVFHAVSAFCNAGFSLYPDNLERFGGNAFFVCVICALITLGGIGFLVIFELLDYFYKKYYRRLTPVRLSLYCKLVLTVSAILVVLGAAALLLFESFNSTNQSDHRLLDAFSFSVNARTAGYNTYPTGALSAASLLFLIMLMFIGGSPASTTGGIKTTSFGITLSMIWAKMRNAEHVVIFKRTVPDDIIAKALATVVIAFAMAVAGTVIVLVVESGSEPLGSSGHELLEVLFEVVSALGTVGLSTGITPELHPVSKLVVAVLMFAGRVGPLTLAISVAAPKTPANIKYPEEQVLVG